MLVLVNVALFVLVSSPISLGLCLVYVLCLGVLMAMLQRCYCERARLAHVRPMSGSLLGVNSGSFVAESSGWVESGHSGSKSDVLGNSWLR